jgi:hypothetical protein
MLIKNMDSEFADVMKAHADRGSHFTTHPTLGYQHVVAELLALLLHIQEVPDSNLSPEAGYPDWFVVFLSRCRRMPAYSLYYVTPLPSIALQLLLIILSFDST